MTHDHHESLRGYHADQVLRDGCAECERRGKDPLVALSHMDTERFAEAWNRALLWRDEQALHVAKCERKLLHELSVWATLLHRHFGIPLYSRPIITPIGDEMAQHDEDTAPRGDEALLRYEIDFDVGVVAPTLADAARIEDKIGKLLIDLPEVNDVFSNLDDEPTDLPPVEDAAATATDV